MQINRHLLRYRVKQQHDTKSGQHLPFAGLVTDDVLEAAEDFPSNDEEGGLVSFLTAPAAVKLPLPAGELAALLAPGAVVGLRETKKKRTPTISIFLVFSIDLLQ